MRLKVEYKADENGEKVVKWNPENFRVYLDDLELDLVNEVRLVIVNQDGESPVASITFCPEEIDIDADTIVALTALLDAAPEISEDDVARDAGVQE